MKNKPTNKFFRETISSPKKCDYKDCLEDGIYSAPKSPNSKEKYFFCLKHIKDYNKRWNYFAGKSQNEIYNFQKNDFFEGRPTFPFSQGVNSKIKFEFSFMFDKEKIQFKERGKRFEKSYDLGFNNEINDSLKLFKLDHAYSSNDLKQRYKELVKKYHPDVKNNIKNKEKMIKKINNAYKILFNHTKFR